ncbi:PQ-loop repeat-containing protein [Noviherbaspirillum galbum]|uniref:PQ-loop repeat-containing protein n=1 Tax=Noviherbaspirillum galbum TaxID=2709383 RepID=A0A6B3SI73_9BURK|nr:PQ-loop repeat-containing protein [Noviherbaspirillum galbum]NEX60360.1 PQ-loop repeat-containing protein [Noviherbaspirillum galbum]
MMTEIVGWISAAILAATISRQVYTQWRTKSVAGVSKWLFIGQLSASLGFTVYSYLVENTVFVLTNFFMFMTAVVGQFIYMHNKRRQDREQGRETQDSKAAA